MLGDTYLKIGEKSAANATFEKAIRCLKKDLTENDAEGNGSIAWCYYESGDPGTSVSYNRAALKIDSSLVYIRLNLGLALLAQGKDAEAQKELTRGVREGTPMLKTSVLEDLEDAKALYPQNAAAIEKAKAIVKSSSK